jgi:hypothetical protein
MIGFKSQKKIGIVVTSALSLFVCFTNANAEPVLSVSDVQANAVNLGGPVSDTSQSIVQNTVTSQPLNIITTITNALSSEVFTAPTETTSGLQYNYRTPTTTTTFDVDAYNYDTLGLGVTSTGANKSGDKYITLSGSVLSSIDTTLSFELSAFGDFSFTQTLFGNTIPQLASFYFGDARQSVTTLPLTTETDLATTSYDAYSVSFNTSTYNLVAGVEQTFYAVVFAQNNVSVNSFQLEATTGNYNFTTTPNITNVVGERVLLGATTLAPIPEPETYAMLVAGLGFIGAASRRKLKNYI